ncbi:MAG: carbohydrate binding family 9 domain-containing protein [Acidimicrobiia bacterium]|nr:carbohydrate binding family 9 domain-containing protein [Acidimicrobiia bacterium]
MAVTRPWLRIVCRIGCAALPAVLSGSVPASVHAQEAGVPAIRDDRKQAAAVQVPSGTIRVDGRLDDEAWSQAAPLTDFVQKEPDEGAPPRAPTEVRFAYDDDALYVAARMYGGPPQAPLGRRDATAAQSDYVLVSFDTYFDRRTAYGFGVTASGVRLDRYYSRDDENVFDSLFDPVWEARVWVDEAGWTAEMWIPFSQLRFNDAVDQVWGLNIQRFTPASNEMDYWVPVPRTEQGWASRFGDLRGISGVRPGRRVELLPYVAGASTLNGTRDRANPFDDGRNLAGRAGADLKMGIGPNLTLDATFNPDFGQVEADPAEVNLTAFETFFQEKRTFFLEGASLLNPAIQNSFFYSRRIGAPPLTAVSGDYVDYPETTTILAAAKLTGRLPSGLSLGFLGAVSDDESAQVAFRGRPDVMSVGVAPRTTQTVARLQQQFGAAGSTVSVMFTGVHRDLQEHDALASLVVKNAITLSGDTLLRFRGGEYQLALWGGFSRIAGTAAAVERVQRSSAHYFQRPDQDHVRLDPTRTDMPGYKTGFLFERTGGTHWLWSAESDLESQGFEPNDLGRLQRGDGIALNLSLRYRETQPGRVFRSYIIGLAQSNGWTYAGDRQRGAFQPSATLTWLNFWTTQITTAFNVRRTDAYLTRGGPLMGTPRGWTVTVQQRGAPATQTTWNGRVVRAGDEDGGFRTTVSGGMSFRPTPRWQLSLEPEFTDEAQPQQYVATLGSGRSETFGRRYVFARIDRTTWVARVRLNFTVRPDMTLDLYAEPFAASGRYRNFGELREPGSRERLVYGAEGSAIEVQPDGSRMVTQGGTRFTLRNNDFNVHSFRSNLVLAWEWRPGSTLYAVWQQNRSLSEALGTRVGAWDLWDSLTAPGSHYFVVKTSVWMPWR